MDRDTLYRRSADEAQRRAERAISQDEREDWLRIAEGWLDLLRKRSTTLDEKFDTMSDEFGTGQKGSAPSGAIFSSGARIVPLPFPLAA